MTCLDPPIVLYPTTEQLHTSDCDCACALDLPCYAPTMTPGTWQAVTDAREIISSPSHPYWHGLYNPLGPIPVAVLNQTAWELWREFAYPVHVESALSRTSDGRRSAITRLAHTGLIRPVSETSRQVLPQRRTLIAWLHVTNACNLRCSYCYLGKTQEHMPREVGQQALEAIFRSAIRHGYRKIQIKYAGGEPLLHFGLIMTLHEHACRLADATSLALDEVILSNGTLLDAAKIKAIQDRSIRLMISLDGIEEPHDIQRPFADGRRSSRQVMSAIDQCLQRGLIPEISMTLSAENAAGLPDTVSYLLERDLPFSLNFYRENAHASASEGLQLRQQMTIQAIQEALGVIERNLPSRSLLGSFIDRSSFVAPHGHPCSVGLDYLIIGPHGEIAKCPMELHRPITHTLVEDPLKTIRRDKKGVQNPHVDAKAGCQDCEWRYWCGGGCPLVAHYTTGRYDVKSPYCEIYKAIYPEVLRLEALRLIRQYDSFLQERSAL